MEKESKKRGVGGELTGTKERGRVKRGKGNQGRDTN